jgi:transcriptional regulator with XRE-family HTH domain
MCMSGNKRGRPSSIVPATMGGALLLEWLSGDSRTASQLAERLGISRSTIHRVITGQRTITYELAVALDDIGAVPFRAWGQAVDVRRPCAELGRG